VAPVKVLIVGAGPTGLTLAASLARRGHDVIAIDRDGGPAADGSWHRVGVMQSEHAHGFRAQVPELLRDEWPEAYESWLELGAEPVSMPLPGGGMAGAVRSRRITYERALRIAARRTPRLRLLTGTVTGIVERGGTVRSVMVDGHRLAGDVVVDASGRGLASAALPTELDRECGISYVGRTYRLRDGVEPGPLTNPTSWGGVFDGYLAIVFPHEAGHLSAVIVRASTDRELRRLRHVDTFQTAAQAIPGMREWTAPDRSEPTSAVVLGGRPRNVYRLQRRVRGLLAIGDAVATTTPTAGRGIAMASMQIRALLALVDAGVDLRDAAEPFGAWCSEHIRPWVEEHIARDTEAVHRLRGGDIDLDRPLTTRAIVDAAVVEPRIALYLPGYLAMTAPPSSLEPAEALARAAYERGWRPAFADGPSRAELLEAISPARGAFLAS
jgi:2-polyprenyl-6-methoxyphenol hydroxylase-like FAD-dependent oxidoreductase